MFRAGYLLTSATSNTTKLEELTPTTAIRALVVQKPFAATASWESTKAASAAVLLAGVAEEAIAGDDPGEGLVGVC